MHDCFKFSNFTEKLYENNSISRLWFIRNELFNEYTLNTFKQSLSHKKEHKNFIDEDLYFRHYLCSVFNQQMNQILYIFNALFKKKNCIAFD